MSHLHFINSWLMSIIRHNIGKKLQKTIMLALSGSLTLFGKCTCPCPCATGTATGGADLDMPPPKGKNNKGEVGRIDSNNN